jgi:hypothetical protein
MTMNRFMTKAVVLLFAGLSACTYGMRPDDFEPANKPAGARVAVRVQGESSDRRGELFSVDSTGVMIGTDRLVRVRWSRLAAMDVDLLDSPYDISFGERVTAEKRARIATVSRFPQGLSGELLQRVLAKFTVATLEDIQ